MKEIIKNWKISKKVFALVIISILSLVVYAGISQVCLNIVRINGTYYQNINNGKDLVADILPPPEYIIESYLTANEIATSDDKAAIDSNIKRMKGLENDYNTRHQFWMKTLSDGELKKVFTVDSYASAVKFYKIINEKFIPAAKSGNKALQQKLLLGDLKTYYQQNRVSIDKVVTLANAWSAKNVNDADSAVLFAIIAEILFSLIAALIIIICGIFIVKSLSKPINKIVKAADSIAGGNLDFKLDIQSKDEIGMLGRSLNKITASLQLLIKDSNMLADAAVKGRLSERAEASKHSGEYKQIIVGVNNTLDALTHPLYIAADTVEKISKGDIPEKIQEEFHGDFNLLKNNLNICIDTIKFLVTDAEMLSAAAVEGRLSERADASKHQGDYKKIIDGLNGTMEAVVGALSMAAETVNRISMGDIPPIIEESYNGDYELIKDNLNICITSINALTADADMLSEAAVDGKLSVRADLSSHHGDYSKIIGGLNSTMDAVVSALSMTANTVERISNGDIPQPISDTYNGDYDRIKNDLNLCISAINALVSDADMLSIAAAEGNLSVRADAGRHQGDYNKIIMGFNQTLDSVILPVQETAEVLGELSKGNLDARVTGEYSGELAELKNTINVTLETISGYITEISHVLNEVAHTNLNIEITAEYKGDFVKIKESINNIIQSLNVMLNSLLGEINHAANDVASGAQQISNSSQNLSDGASQQASTVEQLTASIAEIASQAGQNAKNSNKAKNLAATVMEAAQDGSAYMKDTQSSMSDISSSTVSISNIIKVIDDIAFQTNILSLNAAIEAARAGSYGKGFAVVAEEVRSLANHSEDAAKDIKDLIQNTIQKVAKGSETLNETASKFEEINNGISQISEAVSIIDMSSNDQMEGINQINSGIELVSNVVQTIAATSEENAAASTELSNNSQVLKDQISKFSLK